MKIVSASLPGERYADGLGVLSMNRLKEIVVIAGKNGEGKTRLLNRVFTAGACHLSPVQLESHLKQMKIYEQSLANRARLTQSERTAQENELHRLEGILDHHKALELDTEPISQLQVLRFVPTMLEYNKPSECTLQKEKSAHDRCCELGMDNVGQNVYLYIQHQYRRYSNAINEKLDLVETQEERQCDIHSFIGLNSLVQQFLNINIKGNAAGEATLFGLPLGETKLSEGQKVLLQLCVAIHAQGASLENLILLLDEPENHLHPEALIQYLNVLKKALKNGQIWISTHSIHVLAWAADPSCIWYLHDGKLEYSGKNPEVVLQGLLGGESEVENLQDFINLPAQLAVIQFAYECLTPPTVAEPCAEDTQNNQIIEIAKNLWFSKKSKQVRILDWGAGKGRLADAFSNLTEEYKGKLDYYAYDVSEENILDCQEAIKNLHDDSEVRFFSTEDNLSSNIDKKSVDLVVMCNVLHEIPPNDWSRIFASQGTLCSIIKEEGYLLIVEDSLIPIGEKPHKDGFFILGLGELQELFSANPGSKQIIGHDANGKDRLFAYLISASCIKNANDMTMKNALSKLKKHAEEQIRKLRQKSDTGSGKKLAFWTQQLANVILFLPED